LKRCDQRIVIVLQFVYQCDHGVKFCLGRSSSRFDCVICIRGGGCQYGRPLPDVTA
jgi:hypothetical protein